jgi:hypothetical protein
MVERCHGQLKAALWARLASTEWPEYLPWVLLGLRSAPKEDSAISSTKLIFGTTPSLPAELIQSAEPPAEQFLERLRRMDMPANQPLTYAEVTAKLAAALMEASHVNIRCGGAIPPLAPHYTGPYRVLARQGKFFKLEIGGCQETVSVDCLKPHLVLTPVESAALLVCRRPLAPGPKSRL